MKKIVYFFLRIIFELFILVLWLFSFFLLILGTTTEIIISILENLIVNPIGKIFKLIGNFNKWYLLHKN